MLKRISLAAALIGATLPVLAQVEIRILTVYTPGARTTIGDSANCTANCSLSSTLTTAMIAATNAARTASGITNAVVIDAGTVHLPNTTPGQMHDRLSPTAATQRAWQAGVGDLRDQYFADVVIVIRDGQGAADGTAYACNGGEDWTCTATVIDVTDIANGKRPYETAVGRSWGAGLDGVGDSGGGNAPYWARNWAACPQGNPSSGACPQVAQCFYTLGGQPPANGTAQPCNHVLLKYYGPTPYKTTCSPQEWCDGKANTLHGSQGGVNYTSPLYGVVGKIITPPGVGDPTCSPVGWATSVSPPRFMSIYANPIPLYVAGTDQGAGTIPDDGRCTSGWVAAPLWSAATITSSSGNYGGHPVGQLGQDAAGRMSNKSSTIAAYNSNPVPNGRQGKHLAAAANYFIPGVMVPRR